MNKEILFGISYVSLWVLIWGTVGSLIDYPLLQSEFYLAGSIGQITTFSLTALIAAILGKVLFSNLKNRFNSF